MELAWEGFSGTRPFLRGKLVDAILLTVLVTVILSSFLIGVLLSFVPQIPRDALGDSGVWNDATLFVRSWIGPLASLVDAEHSDYSGNLEIVNQYKAKLSASSVQALASHEVGRPGAGPPVATPPVTTPPVA